MTALFVDYNLHFLLIFCNQQSSPQHQAEGVRVDIAWRPPLPEVKAGKADTDCPSQEDYCEV